MFQFTESSSLLSLVLGFLPLDILFSVSLLRPFAFLSSFFTSTLAFFRHSLLTTFLLPSTLPYSSLYSLSTILSLTLSLTPLWRRLRIRRFELLSSAWKANILTHYTIYAWVRLFAPLGWVTTPPKRANRALAP